MSTIKTAKETYDLSKETQDMSKETCSTTLACRLTNPRMMCVCMHACMYVCMHVRMHVHSKPRHRNLWVKNDRRFFSRDLGSVKRNLGSVTRDLGSVKRDLGSVKRDTLNNASIPGWWEQWRPRPARNIWIYMQCAINMCKMCNITFSKVSAIVNTNSKFHTKLTFENFQLMLRTQCIYIFNAHFIFYTYTFHTRWHGVYTYTHIHTHTHTQVHTHTAHTILHVCSWRETHRHRHRHWHIHTWSDMKGAAYRTYTLLTYTYYIYIHHIHDTYIHNTYINTWREMKSAAYRHIRSVHVYILLHTNTHM
jgi:hypothetical protein